MDEQSIWKKEISFGRKRKESQPEPEEATAEPSPSEPTSIWKKEISFGRKKKSGDPPKPAEDEPEAVTDASDVVQESDPEPGPEETASEEKVWTKEVSFSRTAEPEPVPDIAPVAAAPVEAAAAEAPTETWSATPALPPEPVPQPEAVVVHPPVPAAELPPDPEQRVPFWKKELSFGGGKKREKAPKAPKAARTPKEPKQAKERKQKQPRVKAARGGKGAKRLVGLKVGASQLAAARVSNNG